MPYLEQVKIRHFRNYYTELYQKTFIVTYRFGFRWISVSSVSRLATASSRCLYRALSFISMPSVEFLLFRFSLSAFRFSIVALKDDFNKYSNRFLLHYDTNWNCWFFFSFPTSDSANEEQIRNRMSNILKVDKNLIHLVHKSERLQPKYSLKDCVNKVYQHSLYQAVMGEFSPELKEDSFVLDGVSYKWMTIAEMEADDRIMEVNKDVVSFVKEKIE